MKIVATLIIYFRWQSAEFIKLRIIRYWELMVSGYLNFRNVTQGQRSGFVGNLDLTLFQIKFEERV